MFVSQRSPDKGQNDSNLKFGTHTYLKHVKNVFFFCKITQTAASAKNVIKCAFFISTVKKISIFYGKQVSKSNRRQIDVILNRHIMVFSMYLCDRLGSFFHSYIFFHPYIIKLYEKSINHFLTEYLKGPPQVLKVGSLFG